MTTPLPKKKTDELVSFLNKLKPNEIISEFNYTRCNRLLDQAKTITPKDWWLMLSSLVELSANNLKNANELAKKSYAESSDLRILRNATYVFHHTFDMENVCASINKIITQVELQNLDFKINLPNDFDLDFFLNGSVIDGDMGFSKSAAVCLKYDIDHWVSIGRSVDIAPLEFKAIAQIIHDVVLRNNSRCLLLEYSFINEEFLLLIYVDKCIEDIQNLNTQVFNACYESNLVDVLNKLSYTFIPYDEDEDNE